MEETRNFAMRNLQAFVKQNVASESSGAMNGTRASDYVDSYNEMRNFVDQSLDENKGELRRVLFPVFVCLFLNMMLRKEL